jgi:Tol biopolymer transport system component
MCTRALPFKGESSTETIDLILHRAPVSPVRLNPDVPEELEHIIYKCLEKDRDTRYQSSTDLEVDLRRLSQKYNSGDSFKISKNSINIPNKKPWMVWLAGCTVIVVLVSLIWWYWPVSKLTERIQPGVMRTIRFTTDGGSKMWPSFSPDGKTVAYQWAGKNDENWDIYIKAFGLATNPLRLTTHPDDDMCPVWSPDGLEIAFLRIQESAAIYIVPSMGGKERKLIELDGPVYLGYNFVPALTWSPDGKWFAYSEVTDEERGLTSIVRLSKDTLEKEVLTKFDDSRLTGWESDPQFSPDGQYLAFIRGHRDLGQDVWIRHLDTGQIRQLTNQNYPLCGRPKWASNSQTIIFEAVRLASSASFWRVDLDGATPQVVSGPSQLAMSARDGTHFSIYKERMVYEDWQENPVGIWRIPLRQLSSVSQVSEKIINWADYYGIVNISPDGQKIAFQSNRSGMMQVWFCESDGSDQTPATNWESDISGTPNWSPESTHLVFDSPKEGTWDLYTVDIESLLPKRLTGEPYTEHCGVWSRDGNWIYFFSERGQGIQVYKIASDGGKAIQVTKAGGKFSAESWDGKYLYFTKKSAQSPLEDTSLWRVPTTGGGEEEEVISDLVDGRCWALSPTGIYYAKTEFRGRIQDHRILFRSFETGETKEVFRSEGVYFHGSLAVSPDDSWLVFARGQQSTSELVLVESFQ